MNKGEFKVLDWLRATRDEHSQRVLNQPWEVIHKETTEAADEMERRIEKQRKKKRKFL